MATSKSIVQNLLGRDYDDGAKGGRPPRDLTHFIATAAAVVAKVNACEVAKGHAADGTRMDLMEAWLAAFYYTRSDPIYSSRSAGGASGSYVNDPTDPERYRRGALDLDFHGCLAAVLKGQRAGAFWNGRPPSEQTDYVLRD